MADMWDDLLEVHDEAATAKKTEEELAKFTVDEVRAPARVVRARFARRRARTTRARMFYRPDHDVCLFV
jgi:hypothetical protein